MKHKFVLSKENENATLLIREFAELNKDTFVLVCEASYDAEQIREAMARGREAVLAKVRTPNFYPPITFTERVVSGVLDLMGAEEKRMVELFCEDAEFLTKGLHAVESFEKIEEEEETLDVFIEDDFPDGFDEDKADPIGTSVDIDEDVLEDEEE